MKERSVYKKALTLAVPMMIQNGITNAVSLVDNLMVGSLGTESLTAVSIVGQLIFVFFWPFSVDFPVRESMEHSISDRATKKAFRMCFV